MNSATLLRLAFRQITGTRGSAIRGLRSMPRAQISVSQDNLPQSSQVSRKDDLEPARRSNVPQSRLPNHEHAEAIHLEQDIGRPVKLSPLSTDFDVDCIDLIGKPPLPKSFNLAAYANRSESLQQLVKLGVDLSAIERKRDRAEYILKLDFNKHMKKHIRWLHDKGIPADQIGDFITKNPMVFEEAIQNLQSRVDYLKSKRFSNESVAIILQRFPRFINFSVEKIDARLGLIQKEFRLDANNTRMVLLTFPRIVSLNAMTLKVARIVITDELGFEEEQFQSMIVAEPRLMTANRDMMVARFDYLHNSAALDHEQISRFPKLLTSHGNMIKQRHQYLKKLGKDQFDCSKPGYVPCGALAMGEDAEFCERFAKTSVHDYNLFLKNM